MEGSLKHRFVDRATRSRHAGWCGARPALCRQVYSLAGFVRTTDGTLIAYAFITNGATGEFAAKTWLDEVTAAVAGCGCQG